MLCFGEYIRLVSQLLLLISHFSLVHAMEGARGCSRGGGTQLRLAQRSSTLWLACRRHYNYYSLSPTIEMQ